MIGSAHDPAERAADRMADRALRRQVQPHLAARAAAPARLRRACAKCAEDDENGPGGKTVRRDAAPAAGSRTGSGAAGGAASGQAKANISAMGEGRPLSPAERGFYEPRFNADFSGVRIHDDAVADRAARSVGARAFTLGQDIAFAQGEKSAGGDRLMAHELAHTLQDAPHLQRQDDAWEDDKYFYQDPKKAERRKRKLEADNPDREYKIFDIMIGGKPHLRVRSRPKGQADAKPAGDAAEKPDAPADKPGPDKPAGAAVTQAGAGIGKAQGAAAKAVTGSNNKCTSRTAETDIVKTHTVGNATIAKPGDKAKISIIFGCKPRSLTSEIIDDATGKAIRTFDATIWNGKLKPAAGGLWTLDWDGKRGFNKVGTYMAGDGSYTHRIRNVSYAATQSGEKYAKGGKVLSTAASKIKVENRGAVDKNPAKGVTSRHLFDDTGKKRSDNITTIAGAIKGEANNGNATEKKAIAWAIRNEMVRLNTYKASSAKSHFKFVTKTPGAAETTLAETILGAGISADISSGAIKWYSPKSMPPQKGDCKTNRECGGGKVTLTSDKKRWSYAPSFHKHMSFVAIPGVREWYFRFYKL